MDVNNFSCYSVKNLLQNIRQDTSLLLHIDAYL